jgi:DNA replication protein DnaC
MQIAHLPYRRTLNRFANQRFMVNGDNLLQLGPPGVSKTHLGIGPTIAAIMQGRTAYTELPEAFTRIPSDSRLQTG